MELIAKSPATFFTSLVQFEFTLNPARHSSNEEFITIAGRQIPMILVRNFRARRYLLRLCPDGSARVTIPRGGSTAEARRFAERNQNWLERQLRQLAGRPSKVWLIGNEILFRGEIVRLELAMNGTPGLIRIGNELVKVADPTIN